MKFKSVCHTLNVYAYILLLFVQICTRIHCFIVIKNKDTGDTSLKIIFPSNQLI